jgi:hypothetical protein
MVSDFSLIMFLNIAENKIEHFIIALHSISFSIEIQLQQIFFMFNFAHVEFLISISYFPALICIARAFGIKNCVLGKISIGKQFSHKQNVLR